MRRHSWFPSACLVLFTLATSAAAQTIQVNAPLRPARDKNGNPNRLQPNQVNRTECLADDVITYPLVVSGSTSAVDLEVWAGTNCEALENRASNSATCWLVYEDASPRTRNIDIRVQDIIHGSIDRGSYGGPGSGGEDTCNRGSTSSRSVSLHFLLINSSDQVASKPANTPTVEFDLLGPDAPQNIEAGVGENSLIVKFPSEDDADDDIAKYYVYCEALEGSGDSQSCDPQVLVPDEPPPDQNRCGETTRNAEQIQTRRTLQNGTRYAVGIAAVDRFGNPGPLSAVACGTPEPINGFFEEYRAAGGEGGGGLCSLSRSTTSSGLWLGVGAVACATLVRRRMKGGRR